MKTFLVAFAGGALGTLLVVMAGRWMSPEPLIASVDLKRVLAVHVARLAAENLDDAARQRESAVFAGAIEAALDDVARERGALLLTGGAVVRGAPDFTGLLQGRLEARLQRRTEP